MVSRRSLGSKSDPWPYINFILSILRLAYKEFESRVGKNAPKRGEKREIIAAAIEHMKVPFRVADLQRACPGVGLDHIRKTLAQLKKEKKVKRHLNQRC